MVSEQMCIGPLLCRTSTGECCSVLLIDGSVICPVSCSAGTINSRAVDGADAAGVQEGHSLMNILNSFLGQQDGADERYSLQNIFHSFLSRQDGTQEGYSLQNIFQVSLLGATLLNTLGGFLAPFSNLPVTIPIVIVPVMTMSMPFITALLETFTLSSVLNFNDFLLQ